VSEAGSSGIMDVQKDKLMGFGNNRNRQNSVCYSKAKNSHSDYILRQPGDCLEKEVIQRTIPGSRTRGIPKTAWINITFSHHGLVYHNTSYWKEQG